MDNTTVHPASTNLVQCIFHRYTSASLERHAAWQHTWDLRRKKDSGESVGEIPVLPRCAQDDFHKSDYRRLRCKLDAPKERFISYPGCESEKDGDRRRPVQVESAAPGEPS